MLRNPQKKKKTFFLICVCAPWRADERLGARRGAVGAWDAVDAGEGSSGLPELLAGQHATTRMGLRDGRGAAAKFNHPRGISLDSAGNVVLADAHNNAIRLISPDGDVATLAGALGIAGHADGPGSAALFNNPTGVACCRDGSILVTDTDNHCIRRVSPVRGFHSASSPPPASAAIEWETETVAGRRDAPGHEDASGTSARFCYPGACALDSGGYLVVADAGNDCIRRVSTDDWQVWTVAGMAGSRGHADGVRAEARFSSPAGIAVDIQGNIFVADRKVRASVHVCVCVCVWACGVVLDTSSVSLCLQMHCTEAQANHRITEFGRWRVRMGVSARFVAMRSRGAVMARTTWRVSTSPLPLPLTQEGA